MALLEEYCEALWHLSEALFGGNGNDCASEKVSVNSLPEGSTRASESEEQEDGNMSLSVGSKELLARLEELIGQVKAQIDELPDSMMWFSFPTRPACGTLWKCR